jgi:hypothetical protein
MRAGMQLERKDNTRPHEALEEDKRKGSISCIQLKRLTTGEGQGIIPKKRKGR